MFSSEVLQAIVAASGHIEVLKGPTAEYITVCRPDGTALLEGDLPRAILEDFLKQSYVYQDGSESEKRVTAFRLTPDGVKAGTKLKSQD